MQGLLDFRDACTFFGVTMTLRATFLKSDEWRTPGKLFCIARPHRTATASLSRETTTRRGLKEVIIFSVDVRWDYQWLVYSRLTSQARLGSCLLIMFQAERTACTALACSTWALVVEGAPSRDRPTDLCCTWLYGIAQAAPSAVLFHVRPRNHIQRPVID